MIEFEANWIMQQSVLTGICESKITAFIYQLKVNASKTKDERKAIIDMSSALEFTNIWGRFHEASVIYNTTIAIFIEYREPCSKVFPKIIYL